ncbi:MAG: DNA gyrase subunit A [Planctomycetota bacterium]|nr:DNA gyrase subunit A [Planctomycetota bacterium]
MSTDGTPPTEEESFLDLPIEEELKGSYLTYAMSVIVSRALPDVRDGLKPSQRRILVAMSDLNLSPGAARIKCAKISGDTSGNYHPHGESVIYPTLVRMAQEWNMRHVLVDKQGNFGSIAGLPPAAMRYTEARLSGAASMMLDDLKLDTVDYVPTYDERRTEPTVLPSKFPNLLVNGSSGIAVSMATSIPPHNLKEVCEALKLVLDRPDCSILEIIQVMPGPDFPTGGIICGQSGIRRAYLSGRSTIVVRARCEIIERSRNRHQIVVSEIPYQQTRDNVVEKIANVIKLDKIKGISGISDVSDLKEPVRLLIDIKANEDPDVILNQLYQFTPLQTSISMIFLALVDGKPRELNIKQLLEEFVRHRITVIRRRTQFLLAKARKRKHVVEGLLLALADIDQIIKIIRASKTQAEAKSGLMGVGCPASMMKRALGEDGFQAFQLERGVADAYNLTPIQADAILRMTLGQLVNLEQEKLGNEHQALLDEINEYLRILSDEQNIRQIIRDDLEEIQRKHGNDRLTEISGEDLSDIDLEDLITEENMVVSISHRGYIKRTPVSAYRAQRRGGKGLKGARTDEEDPIEHLFAASTHDYLLFFTTKGRVYWQKVYGLPQQSRDAKGRNVVNLLQLDEGEEIADCRAVRDFSAENHYLLMATKKGLVKKTVLSAYSRPYKGGIIAIKLREDDELVDVVVAKDGDDIVLSTSNGMAIRFNQEDARSTGRNSSGVKGITLTGDDELVGMVVAEPEQTLLTVCENGFGKRTRFGASSTVEGDEEPVDETSGTARYRCQRRGGKGLRDIKAGGRNGKVISIVRVDEDDEILMMTARGKLQRIAVNEIGIVGRNTKGVRIMKLDEGDSLSAVVRVPPEEEGNEEASAEGGEEFTPAGDTGSAPQSAEEGLDPAKGMNEENSVDPGEEPGDESESS